MKKQLIILATMAFFIALLSGCGGEANDSKEELPRLSEVGLPTPPPTPARATATPFPKITLAATEVAVHAEKAVATPTIKPADVINSDATGELTYSGDMDALADKVTELSGGYRPVAAGLISAQEGVTVKEAPAESSETVGQAPTREVIGILGVDKSGNWLYILTVSLLQGWVPANTVHVTGTLKDAPTLAVDGESGVVVDAADASSTVTANKAADAAMETAPTTAATAVSGIAGVVNTFGVNVRSGPGVDFDVLGRAAEGESVTVVAVDPQAGWVIINHPKGLVGWVNPKFLDLDGDLSQLEGQQPLPAATTAPTDAVGNTSATSAGVSGVASLPAEGNSANSRIVFQTSSGGDIMVINPNGSGLRRLTHGIDPVLSPDGQTVAFTRWQGDDGSLWLIGVDGSNERAVLGATKQAKHPAWSPDGRRIVVNFQHGGRLDTKGQCASLLENDPNDIARGLPWNVDRDSVEVVYKGMFPFMCWELPPDPHWSARMVNLADGSYEDLVAGNYAFGAEWDPANNWRIVNSGLTGLTQLDVNRNEQWALTDRRQDHTPAFSPDGHTIAVAYNNNGAYDIHRLDAGGNGRVQLTKTPLWVTTPGLGEGTWNNVAPVWSPDGSQIAFLTDRTGRWEIWVMNADGANAHPMFSDAVNNQLHINYDFVDERVFSWR